VDAWSALAAEQDVQLDVRLEGRPSARVTPGRIEQVLDNLLANALEVAPGGSTVGVHAARADDRIEIRIRDRGPGMSDDEIGRAFDRFWRARSGEEGFGLGLPIVQRLVRADGGEVELRRRAGGGLECLVTLRAPDRR
jgi:signal transduction histidine kinase